MKEYIEERAVAIANYIIDHNATVRQTAKKFGISKSTVHKDVTDRLEHINPSSGGPGQDRAGREQVGAAHPGRDGYPGKVSAPAGDLQ